MDNKFKKRMKHPGDQNMLQSWWERVDSDHRSETQQIYSLPPLATREHSHIKLKKKLELVDGLEPPTC